MLHKRTKQQTVEDNHAMVRRKVSNERSIKMCFVPFEQIIICFRFEVLVVVLIFFDKLYQRCPVCVCIVPQISFVAFSSNLFEVVILFHLSILNLSLQEGGEVVLSLLCGTYSSLCCRLLLFFIVSYLLVNSFFLELNVIRGKISNSVFVGFLVSFVILILHEI